MLALVLIVAAAVPGVLTEVSPALALRWRSLGTLHLQSDAPAEVELRASPVLRLEGDLGGCHPIYSRRFGGVDVPLPGQELTVSLPPALAPTEERDGEITPATVGVRLSPGCRPTNVQAYEATTAPDPYASQLVTDELHRLLKDRASPEALAEWLAASHPHRWQQDAALALAIPALGGSRALAEGLLEQATAPVRSSEPAFVFTRDLSRGSTRSLSGGSWMSLAAGASVDLDVAGTEVVRLGHRAVAPTSDGASPAWRFSVTFDEGSTRAVVAHAPIDPDAPDVSLGRSTVLVVPPGARRMRIKAGEGGVLLSPLGVRPKGALAAPFHRTAAEWLAEASSEGGWSGRVATALLHPDGKPLPLPAGKGPLGKALADLLDVKAARARAEASLAIGNAGQALRTWLSLAARHPLTDEDAEALLDADAFAEESLSAHPQALLVVDGLLSHRPLDHQLVLIRQHAFRGAARWEELSIEPGGRATNFLDPQSPTATALGPEHARFAAVEGTRKVVLAAPPLPGNQPLLGLVTVRHPGEPVLSRVTIDGAPVALPAVGPLERVDVPLAPGPHQVTAPPGVLVNWTSGPGPRWRRYLDVGKTPLPLHDRDVGAGAVLLVAVRVISAAPVGPLRLVVAGDDSPPVTLAVHPGPPRLGVGELDPDVGASDPVEVIVPVGGTSATFTVVAPDVPAGARVLVHVATRCRAPVAVRERPLPPLAPGIAAALARDQGRANWDAVSAITRRLEREPAGAGAWLARAAALAGIDQSSLAREDLVRAVADRGMETATRRLALALWRHLEKSGSSSYPETVDRRSVRPPLDFRPAPAALIDDRPALRTLDVAALRTRGGDLALLAAARRAERDDDQARAATLWQALARERPQAVYFARAGAALLALPPDAVRDVTAYIALHRATELDPHDRLAARLLRRAAARTRLRPVHQVDDSAGTISVDAADPFESSVEGALLPGRAGELVTGSRQLALSFDLATPMTVRMTGVIRELRPEGAAALGSPGVALVWSKDGEPPHPVACGRGPVCRGPAITLPAGAHSLQVRVQGGLRPAARVQVTPVCSGPCGRSPFERSADYLVARPEQPVAVTLFGPAVVEAELRAPAGTVREVSVGLHPGPNRRVLLPGAADRRLVSYDEDRRESSAVETVVLERHQTYRLVLRPDRGAVLCRLVLREAGEGASSIDRLPVQARADAPRPLLTPPDLDHALAINVVDGDVTPGWDDFGALTVELGYRTAVDLTEDRGVLARRRAGLAAITYRRLFEGLHLTMKVGVEARVWQGGRPSQAGNVDLYFLHPAARWLRLFASVDGITQPVAGQQASAAIGQFTVEPIITPASALHLVSKLGMTLQYQSLARADEALVDPDVYSTYAGRRPHVLFWEEDVELEPLSDLLIFGGGRLTTRSDMDVRHPDHASASVVARTVLGRFFVEAGFRWSWFFTGPDRAASVVSRRASLSLLHTFWLGHKNSLLVGVQAAQHIDLHAPEIAVRLGWEFSNGRRLTDHTPVEGENYFYPARGPGREAGRLDVGP